VRINIAGVISVIELPSETWSASLVERYAPFLVDSDAGPEVAPWHVTLLCESTIGHTGAAWIRHNGPVTTFRVPALEGRIDLAKRFAVASTPSEMHAASALDRVVAYICMQALPRERDALWLHAAGIVRNGKGQVFFGPSGAGKTTVAALAGKWGELLCDENVVVRPGPDGPKLFSTPFWGHSTPPELIRRVNRRARLTGLYALRQAPAFALERLSAAEAVMALLGTEKVATERAESASAWLDVAERLVTQVAVYRLDFRPTAELWEFLGHRLDLS